MFILVIHFYRIYNKSLKSKCCEWLALFPLGKWIFAILLMTTMLFKKIS